MLKDYEGFFEDLPYGTRLPDFENFRARFQDRFSEGHEDQQPVKRKAVADHTPYHDPYTTHGAYQTPAAYPAPAAPAYGAYHEPAPYTPPAPAYHEPEPYSPPKLVEPYHAPAPAPYHPPAPYTPPEPYHAPAPAYHEPEPYSTHWIHT